MDVDTWSKILEIGRDHRRRSVRRLGPVMCLLAQGLSKSERC